MISYLSKKCKSFGVVGGSIKKLKKGYIYENGQFNKIYSSGNIVTYYVESNISYQEEVDEGASCLSPKTFTPAKSGWTFVGWRVDKTANATVLTSKVMGDEPITLYAVFTQVITLTTVANSVTSKKTGNRYYNNGNALNPTFTVANPTKTSATFNGWSTSKSSTTITNTTISNLSLSASTTRYAVFTYKNATLLTTGTGYLEYSSYSGSTALPSVNAAMYRAITFAGWYGFRAGTTTSTDSGTGYLRLGGVNVFSASWNRGVGWNYNVNITFNISATSGTLTWSRYPDEYMAVVKQDTGKAATIVGIGRTVVG